MTLEAYVEVGDATRLWTMTGGQGMPAVFNHGGPGGYDELGPLAALIDDIALVHRYDQRGGGRSPSAGPFSIQRFVTDLERLRRYWRHERWIVIGHSWGAHLALFYALEHPARVAGLIFISGPPITWGWGSSRRQQRLPRLTAEERLELAELEEQLARGPDERASRRLRELWWLTDFADRRRAAQSHPSTDYPRSQSLITQVEIDWQRWLQPDLHRRVRSLTVPSLVLHGERDPLPAEGPRRLADLLPQGEWRQLPAVGHIPWLERTTELRHALRAFLA